MKATYNLSTQVLEVTGKEIKPFKKKVTEPHDYWNSVKDEKTGEPLYDINLFFDDFANDGGDENNHKNYQAQFVNLKKNDKGEILTGSNYQTMKLTVVGKIPVKVKKVKKNPSLTVALSERDLQELQGGKTFDWSFLTDKGATIDVHVKLED